MRKKLINLIWPEITIKSVEFAVLQLSEWSKNKYLIWRKFKNKSSEYLWIFNYIFGVSNMIFSMISIRVIVHSLAISCFTHKLHFNRRSSNKLKESPHRHFSNIFGRETYIGDMSARIYPLINERTIGKRLFLNILRNIYWLNSCVCGTNVPGERFVGKTNP